MPDPLILTLVEYFEGLINIHVICPEMYVDNSYKYLYIEVLININLFIWGMKF